MTAKETPVLLNIEHTEYLTKNVNELVQHLYIDLNDDFQTGKDFLFTIWSSYLSSDVDFPKSEREETSAVFKALWDFFNKLPQVKENHVYLEVQALLVGFTFTDLYNQVFNMFYEYAINTDDDPETRRENTTYFKNITGFLESARILFKSLQK